MIHHVSLTRDELIKDLLSVIIHSHPIIIISTHTRRKGSIRVILVVMMMIVVIIVVIRKNSLHKGNSRFDVALTSLLSSVDVNGLGEG